MRRGQVRWRKILFIALGIIAGLFLVLFLVLSPLLKYFIEKYDEKFTGRQITLSWAIVNPLTGYVHLDGIRVYEQDSDTVFFSAGGISTQISVPGLLSGEYRINYLTLSEPDIKIIQYQEGRFNFSDLVEKFSGKEDKDEKEERPGTRFSLLDIKIEDGTFHWQEHITPVSYFIKDVFIRSGGFSWNSDTVAARLDFNSGIGSGKFEIDFSLNVKNSDYHSHVIIRRLDLAIIEQYLHELARFGKFHALINLDITADGNLKDARNINAVGGVGIYDFSFGNNEHEDLAAFKKFVMKIDHLNPSQNIYDIDSVSLVQPVVRYEKYDHLDNIQRIFGEKGSKLKEAASSEKFNLVIAIADYVNVLGRNFFRSSYTINRIGVYNAGLQYHDYSLNEQFKIALQPLTLTADSLSSSHRARLRLSSAIRPYGRLRVDLSINPQDSSDFDLDYHLEKLNAAVLNPYLLRYTSYPLDRGSIELKGNWRVKNGNIRSNNHLLIIDPRIADRVRTEQNKWLPMKLIMFVVRERGNAIDYEIPIAGNLKDPKLSVGDVLFDALTNIFVKPLTSRYRREVRNIESKIERQISFNWLPGSVQLLAGQDEHVKEVAGFLRDNKTARIEVQAVYYQEKEKEHLAFFEARKKYFLETRKVNVLAAADSLEIQNIAVKDSTFTRHMRDKTGVKEFPTQQQLCEAYVGQALISKKYSALKAARRDRFLRYFEEEKVRDRVKIKKEEERVPFNGFSFHQISYSGEIPEEMKAAYEKLLLYDNSKPRSKFKMERKKTRRFFNSRGG